MPAASTTRRPYAPRLPIEERRQQVLDAALELIIGEGYRGVTMEAVARRVGVTKPVVYDAFPNQGELLRALLEREEARALAALAEIVPSAGDGDPDDLLAQALEAFLVTVRESPDTWSLILMPAEGTPEVVRRHVRRGRVEVLERLEALVAWGVERRGGPAWADAELLARAIQGLAEGAARLVLTDGERFPPERIVTLARSLMADLDRGERA